MWENFASGTKNFMMSKLLKSLNAKYTTILSLTIRQPPHHPRCIRQLHHQIKYSRSVLSPLPQAAFHCDKISRYNLHSGLLSHSSQLLTQNQVKAIRFLSSHQRDSPEVGKPEDTPQEEDDSKMTVFQRFKKVYKEYGKTLIAVHVVTSIGWYGAFYLMAYSGIDLLPLLIKMGIGETLQQKYMAAGDFLVAYILYEIAKPVRYLATLGATRQTVMYLRKTGYLPPIATEDKLRNLAKDGRDNMREKYQDRRDNLKEKYQDKKAEYQDKWQQHRGSKGVVNRKRPFWKAQKQHHSRPSPHSTSHRSSQTNQTSKSHDKNTGYSDKPNNDPTDKK